jgi:hypothetical protein
MKTEVIRTYNKLHYLSGVSTVCPRFLIGLATISAPFPPYMHKKDVYHLTDIMKLVCVMV